MMLQATDEMPMNFGFSSKGNTSDPAGMYACIEAGAAGFKLHEDWGTTPSSIDACLTFAEQHDVAVTIHTDTLNESGYVDDSIAAIKGRTMHTYHSEGAGGGHAPPLFPLGLPQTSAGVPLAVRGRHLSSSPNRHRPSRAAPASQRRRTTDRHDPHRRRPCR